MIEGGVEVARASKSFDGCQMMVFGDNLKQFNYKGEFLNECCICNSSSLNEAKIRVVDYSSKRLRRTAYRLYKLLRGFSTVEHLTISYYIFEVVLDDAPELLAQLPWFNDLITLEFEASVNIGSKPFLSMLHNCPCLQTLIFLEGIEESSNVAKDGVLEPLPPCFLSHLKEIEVSEFYGDEDHIHALKVLLKNAMVLEKMTITWGTDFEVGLERKSDVHKQLFDLPRVSKSCEVVLELLV